MQLGFPAFFLFMFSPVLALFYGLLQLRDVMSRNLIWLFCSFFGMAFYMGSADGTDSTRYADWLSTMHQNVMSLETFTSAFYQEGQMYYDIYQPLTTFLVSRYTDDYRILFGLYGFVIGFFFSRIIGFFVDECPYPLGFAENSLLFCVAFTISVGNAINGVRMYTAMFVFLYGFLYFWKTKNPVYFTIACSSILFHFSFLIPVTILFAMPTIFKFPWLVYAGFLGSFLFTAIEIQLIRGWVESLPLGIESRVAGYLAGSDGEGSLPRIVVVIEWLNKVFRILACTYLLVLNRPGASPNLTLIVFAMTMNACVNVLGEVGSLGRFSALSQILITGHLIMHVNMSQHADTKLMVSVIGVLAMLNALLGLRMFLGFSSTNLLLANPITIWFFSDPEMSLYDYMPKVLSGF